MIDTNQPKYIVPGCLSGVINLGALASGVYRGVAESNGVYVTAQEAETFYKGTLAASGLLGLIQGNIITSDEDYVSEIYSTKPPEITDEQAAGCVKAGGCLGLPVSLLLTWGFHELGRYIGRTASG